MSKAAELADPAGDLQAKVSQLYLLAFGSNVRVPGVGGPRQVIAAAISDLEDLGLRFHGISPLICSAPVGPSQRQYANAAAVVETFRTPPSMLLLARAVEQGLGRKRRGQVWRSRTLDIDIVLWDGGMFAIDDLVIPHPRFRDRDFVLGPAKAIAGDWRDPVTGLSCAHLFARLTRPRPVPR
ncbi:2-amino-4-hydroxy-6-hydroxymethyldihydropteridine diphosphokinase [Altererythrobacter sp. GH1-8]|uniref:2-amino-4-hydroxy-6- hydroxymethyldihydropteridine diphosphokinase n=1 Tax=Altererythrobacter sp. GH1-8 TaxID=3349333 RepID=UPI00374CE59F